MGPDPHPVDETTPALEYKVRVIHGLHDHTAQTPGMLNGSQMAGSLFPKNSTAAVRFHVPHGLQPPAMRCRSVIASKKARESSANVWRLPWSNRPTHSSVSVGIRKSNCHMSGLSKKMESGFVDPAKSFMPTTARSWFQNFVIGSAIRVIRATFLLQPMTTTTATL